MIPYGHQSVDEDDIDAVVAVLRGDWLTQGPAVQVFEDHLCATTGAPHAVAFSSGTAALHGAVTVAGLGPGSTVATSALTFSASAACALYVGATPRVLDIDPATLNLDPTHLPPGLDALVAVHYAGLPVDLAALPYRPPVVIEDAAHALGASTPDGPVGSCTAADMSVFSFHPVKAITTGEGGAVTTRSAELADGLRAFRNHGIRRGSDDEGWSYQVVSLGFNYRMTDFQAALGTSQLRRLDQFVERRNDLAARYRVALSDLPVQLPPAAPPGWRHAYHLFPVRVPHRRRIFDDLRSAGIGVQVHYVPLHHHPLYAPFCRPSELTATEDAYAGLLSLPLYPGLTDEAQDTVVEQLTRAVERRP